VNMIRNWVMLAVGIVGVIDMNHATVDSKPMLLQRISSKVNIEGMIPTVTRNVNHVSNVVGRLKPQFRGKRSNENGDSDNGILKMGRQKTIVGSSPLDGKTIPSTGKINGHRTQTGSIRIGKN